MSSLTRWSFAALLALALGAAGCGSSAPAKGCGPDTCVGCCDATGTCQPSEAAHCGQRGAACTPCGSGDLCISGVCTAEGSGGSGATSSASTSSGSATSTSSSSGGATSSSSTSTSSTTTSTTGSTGSTTTSSTGSTGSTGGECCLTLNCSGGCDPVACSCLPTTTSSTTSTSGTTGSSGSVDAGICSSQSCVVYAESARTLYQVDPASPSNITALCTFKGQIYPDAGVNDIAVQRNGALYGLTKNDVFQIDPQTCSGTKVATLVSGHGQYNCLTFTDSDTLLAADINGQVVTIDITNGSVADAGRFGTNLGCSGDIVALSNGTVYATAKVLNDGGTNDLLVTLDPASGYFATPVSSNTLGYKGVFGLGYWAGTLYGFDRNGNVLSIDPVAGTASLIQNASGTVFYGAGTTPLAPVVTH